MTLSEIEKSTGVPASFLIEKLGMPTDVPLNVGIAKLGKRYDFDIEDVRRIAKIYTSSK